MDLSLVLFAPTARPTHPEFIAVWLGNLLLLVVKHRAELAHLPGIRPGLLKLFRRPG